MTPRYVPREYTAVCERLGRPGMAAVVTLVLLTLGDIQIFSLLNELWKPFEPTTFSPAVCSIKSLALQKRAVRVGQGGRINRCTYNYCAYYVLTPGWVADVKLLQKPPLYGQEEQTGMQGQLAREMTVTLNVLPPSHRPAQGVREPGVFCSGTEWQTVAQVMSDCEEREAEWMPTLAKGVEYACHASANGQQAFLDVEPPYHVWTLSGAYALAALVLTVFGAVCLRVIWRQLTRAEQGEGSNGFQGGEASNGYESDSFSWSECSSSRRSVADPFAVLNADRAHRGHGGGAVPGDGVDVNEPWGGIGPNTRVIGSLRPPKRSARRPSIPHLFGLVTSSHKGPSADDGAGACASCAPGCAPPPASAGRTPRRGSLSSLFSPRSAAQAAHTPTPRTSGVDEASATNGSGASANELF